MFVFFFFFLDLKATGLEGLLKAASSSSEEESGFCVRKCLRGGAILKKLLKRLFLFSSIQQVYPASIFTSSGYHMYHDIKILEVWREMSITL